MTDFPLMKLKVQDHTVRSKWVGDIAISIFVKYSFHWWKPKEMVELKRDCLFVLNENDLSNSRFC